VGQGRVHRAWKRLSDVFVNDLPVIWKIEKKI